MKNRDYINALLLILLVTVMLRFFYLEKPSIRGDEGYSVFVAEKENFKGIVNEIKGEGHPFFYYTLLHFWIKLSNSEFHIRLLSVIFSVLSVAMVFLLGRKIFDNNVGILSSLIMAVSQFHIRYAQVARSYSLQLFLVLVSSYFFILLLKERKLHYLALYIISSVLMVYTHYYTFLVVIAQNIVFFALDREDLKILKEWFITQMGIFALLVPWIPILKYQLANIAEIFESNIMASTINLSLFGFDSSNIFLRIAMIFFHFSVGYLQFNLKSYIFIALFLSTVLIFGYAFLKGAKAVLHKKRPVLLGLLFIPVLILAIAWLLKLTSPLPYARYLMFVSPFYYIIVSKGILELKNKKLALGIIFAVLIVIINIFSLGVYYKTNYKNEDWREISAYIEDNSESREVIAIYPVTYIYDFHYYFKKDMKTFGIPSLIDLSKRDYTQGIIAKYSNIITEENMCSIKNITKGNSGIWYVHSNPEEWDSRRLVEKCLSENYAFDESIESIWSDTKGTERTGIIASHYKMSKN